MLSKYFKPRSLTWLVGVAALLMGVTMAIAGNVTSLAALAGFLGDLTGNAEPYMLITYGLTSIGIRGAIK